jgi:hypothetical protein
MLLFDIPRGTTLESLVLEVAPAAHGKLVPATVGLDALSCGVHFIGGGGARSRSFTVRVTGPTMRAREEPEQSDVDMWIAIDAGTAQIFLDDVLGAGRWLPKFVPPTDLKLMSDPRAFKLLKLAQGKLELALVDFAGAPGRRASLWVCVGPQARKPVRLEKADVTIETTCAVYERVLAGSMPPDELLASGDVTLRGKRLVAMQFALAMTPLYPKKR